MHKHGLFVSGEFICKCFSNGLDVIYSDMPWYVHNIKKCVPRRESSKILKGKRFPRCQLFAAIHVLAMRNNLHAKYILTTSIAPPTPWILYEWKLLPCRKTMEAFCAINYSLFPDADTLFMHIQHRNTSHVQPKDKGRIAVLNDVMKWKHLQRYWPFVRGIHRSPVNSSHKGQWRGAFMLSLICAWTNVA